MGFLSTHGSFVLFLPQSSRVLNCGDHDGTTSVTLSACSRTVVCICPDVATARLVNRQILDRQVSNILLVVGAEEDLPFQERTFSLVIHHFFSYDCFSAKTGKHIIIRKVREIFRVAEDVGTVYVAFETGGSCVKGNLRKLGLLFGVFRLSFARKWSLVSTAFHYESFKELFFIRCFSLGNLLNPEAVFFFLKRCVAGSNIGFVFSGNPGDYTSLLPVTRIKRKISKETASNPEKVLCYRIGSGGSVIVEFSEYIVRIPLTGAASVYAARNYKALELLAAMATPFVAPQPVITGSAAGFDFYCETKLPGISLDLEEFSASQEEQIEKMAVESISSPSMQICEVDSSSLKNVLDIPFTELKQFVSGDNKRVIEKALQHIRQLFLHEHLPLVIVHGDFKKSNFIVQSANSAQAVGLIDWECMEIPGLPLTDLLRFLIFDVYGWEDDNTDIVPNLWEMVQKNEYPSAVLTYCDRFKIPLHLLPSLYIAFFAWYLNSYCKDQIQSQDEYRHDVLEIKFTRVVTRYLDMAVI